LLFHFFVYGEKAFLMKLFNFHFDISHLLIMKMER
jgi:hypothetical protein